MNPVPLILPNPLRERLGVDAPAQFTAIGNTDLLQQPVLGLIASRHCVPDLSPDSPLWAFTAVNLPPGEST